MCGCGGEFKEAPPLFKIRCWEGGALCGLGRTPGLFSKGLPPPIPSSCRPSVPPGLLSEGGVSPALPLALPTPFPGAREEDWGSRLFLGKVSLVPETPFLPWVARPLLPPAQLTPSGPRASTPPFPAASRAVLGPDVSLASPPQASGQRPGAASPSPRPAAPSRPQPRPTGPAP